MGRFSRRWFSTGVPQPWPKCKTQHKSLEMHPPFRELLVSWTLVGSLARSRKRARSYGAWVRACEVSGFSRSYMCERLSDDRRVSDESLSFSRLGGLSLAHNKHGSKSSPPPPDETRTGERRGPENVRLSTGAKHDQTHASRPAARRCLCVASTGRIIMLAKTFAPLRPHSDKTEGVTFRTYDAYGFGRSLFYGLEAFQIS